MAKDILYPFRYLHGLLHDHWEYRKKRKLIKMHYMQKIAENKKTKTPFVFLVLTPEHGNMGDHAIAHTETELLKKAGLAWIEITGKQLEHMRRYKLFGIMNKHPVFINGGGNLGTLWIDVEHIHREIILANPKSSIVIFPNTIFYEASDWGNDELTKSIEIYGKHKHLTIYAREKISYEFMKPIYRDVHLVPDMVLSLKPITKKYNRHGCLLCLRKDCEKTRTAAQEQEIRRQVCALFGDDITDTDMVKQGGVPVEQRTVALQEKFAEFSTAKLVITDRLHCMIFCAVTGTPCIVVNSKSPKVRGCYEWIQHLEYIHFVDDVSRIQEVYARIPPKEHIYDNSHLMPYYEKLAKDVTAICRKLV